MATKPARPGFLTAKQLADRVGTYSEQQIRRMAKAGRIPGAENVGTGECEHYRFPPAVVDMLKPKIEPAPGLLAAPLPHPCA